jgi:hypothetical protein
MRQRCWACDGRMRTTFQLQVLARPVTGHPVPCPYMMVTDPNMAIQKGTVQGAILLWLSVRDVRAVLVEVPSLPPLSVGIWETAGGLKMSTTVLLFVLLTRGTGCWCLTWCCLCGWLLAFDCVRLCCLFGWLLRWAQQYYCNTIHIYIYIYIILCISLVSKIPESRDAS